MAVAAARELKIGTLINKTLDVLEKNWATALLFIVLFGVMNIGVTYFALSRTAIMQQLGLTGASFIIGALLNYFLIRTLVQKTGLMGRGEGGHLIPFIGLSILHTLGFILGLFAIILPGLFILARWSVAQPLFISRGGGVMEALGQSWEQTKGNEFPIIVAGLALVILFLAISIVAPFMLGRETLAGLLVSQASSAVMTVIVACFSVALFGLIVASREVVETFD